MKRKFLTLFLALAASVGTIFAQSGTWGTNCTWNRMPSTVALH